jgi:hypothetical protein
MYPLALVKDSHGSAGAAGDGVGQVLTLFNDATTEKTAARYRTEWANAANGSESSDFVLQLMGAGNLYDAFRFNGLGGLQMPTVTTAPGAPASGKGVLYFDTSGGKTRLMARFPTGAAQQVAIEP